MVPMNRLAATAALLLAVPFLNGSAWAQAAAPISAMDVESETATAQVVAVNPATRVVALKMEDGDVVDITAPEEVRNFAQIKVGDVVVANLQRSLTYTVSPADTKLPPVHMSGVAARAKKGERPAGYDRQTTSLTGVITAVDVPNHTLSVVGLNGGPVHVLHVQNPERQAYLPKITPGSLLTITYASSVAVEVTPAAK